MIDIRGLVLHKILNKETGYLDAWANIKLAYFGTEYATIYRALSKFYINHGDLPSFDELLLKNRNPTLQNSLEALKLIEDIDVSIDLVVTALVNEYTQEETLKELDGFLDEIHNLESEEIKEALGQVLLNLEEKTLSSEEIVLMSDIELIQEREDLRLMPLGINNTFDAEIGGMSPTEFLTIGGYRGTGKSMVCMNLSTEQVVQGGSSIYFSIEMRARECFNRHLAILSGVPLSHITKASLTDDELEKIAITRAGMFKDSTDLLEEFLLDRDYRKFETALRHTRELTDNRLIIVDNQNLSLANIDLTIQKFKAQQGDRLKLVVVDYLNQIDVPDKYEWKTQIAISAKLKSFARKYDLIIAAPYQVDSTGNARFSKGILDSVDIAMVLSREPELITFKSDKTRNMKKFEFTSVVDEETLRIDPDDTKVPLNREEAEPEKKKPSEPTNDIPW